MSQGQWSVLAIFQHFPYPLFSDMPLRDTRVTFGSGLENHLGSITTKDQYSDRPRLQPASLLPGKILDLFCRDDLIFSASIALAAAW